MPTNKHVIEVQGKGFGKVKGQAKGLSGSMEGLAKKVGLVAGAYFAGRGLINAFQFATRVGQEFTQSMANLKAISGASASEMAKLSANAKALGSSTKFTASQVGELSVNYAKLGFSASQILKVSEATLNLASATGEDLATSSAVAGGTLRGFGLEAEQTGMLTDVMAKSFGTSALDLTKFANAMEYVAPVAKTMGFSVQETTAILGQLANSSISGSRAGTGLSTVLMEMSIKGSKLSQVFGKSVNNFEEFVEVLQDTKKQGGLTDAQLLKIPKLLRGTIPILIESSDKLMDYKNSLDEAGGSAKKMADIQMDTLEGKMLEFNSALEGVGIALFEMMEEPLKSATEGLTEFAQGMDAERMKSYATALGIMAGAYAVYNVNVIIATVSTRAFRVALTNTGIGALVVMAGILIGKILELSGVFESVTDEANLSADAIDRSRIASENYQKSIEQMGVDKVAKEMAEARDELSFYTAELKLQEVELENISGSYEKYIRNRQDDSVATKNLLSAYDKYLYQQKTFTAITGEATKSLDEFTASRIEESGSIQDGITSYEMWQDIVIKQAGVVQGNLKLTKENIAQIEAEIEVLKKRATVVAEQGGGKGGGDDEATKLIELTMLMEKLAEKKDAKMQKDIDSLAINLALADNLDVVTAKHYEQAEAIAGGKDALAKINLAYDQHLASLEVQKEAKIEQIAIELALEKGIDDVTEAIRKQARAMVENADATAVMSESQKFGEHLGEMQEKIDPFISATSDLYQGLYDMKKNERDKDMAEEIKAVQNSTMSEQTKQAKISNIRDTYDEKDKEARKKMKPVKYAEALSSIALGVSKALGTGVPPWNLILAGIVASAGAVQLGVIASSPYALGGQIKGGSHAQGGVNINAEGGEFIMRKKAVEKLGIPFMEAINIGDKTLIKERVEIFKEGGLVTSSITEIFKEGGLVTNIERFKEGGLTTNNIEKFKEGGLVERFKEGGLVTNNIFQEGGLVNGFEIAEQGDALKKINNLVQDLAGMKGYSMLGNFGTKLAVNGGIEKGRYEQGGLVTNNTYRETISKFQEGGLVTNIYKEGGLVTNTIEKFKEGGLVTNTIERVSISTIPSPEPTQAPQTNYNISISAPLLDDTVVDSIIPAIDRARREGLA